MEKDYRLLIIAVKGQIGHLARFISNLKTENPNIAISLLINQRENGFPQQILDSVSDYTCFEDCHDSFRTKVKSLLSLYKALKKVSRQGHYDIVNIHVPVYYLGLFIPIIKKMASSIVISPWGSDILKVSGFPWRLLVHSVLKKADYLTVVNDSMIDKKLRKENSIAVDRYVPISWGSETIDYINEKKDSITKKQAKSELGLENAYIITCGYNAYPSQQHLKIIEELSKVSSQLPSETILLFPVTYGDAKREEYVKRLKDKCEQSGVRAVFFEQYLSLPELFLIRMASDMFIHVQTTDAGNSSLQEYVLCGNKVIQGTWNSYYDLEKKYSPLFYFPLDSMDDLGGVVINAIKEEPIKIPEEIISIFKSCGWKERIIEWDEFFKKLVDHRV